MWPLRASRQPICSYRGLGIQRFVVGDPRIAPAYQGRIPWPTVDHTGPEATTDRGVLRDARNRQLRGMGEELGTNESVGRDQTSRAISSARLKALQPVHLRPINLVVSQGPSGTLRSRIVHLGDGFPLRCIQRLSAHDIATGRCPWRDSPYTGGHFVPVLSY